MNEAVYYNKTNYSYYWLVSLEMKMLYITSSKKLSNIKNDP